MTGFWDAINNYTEPTVAPIEYRVYYDEKGNILFYTSEDLPGDHLVISHEEYTLGRYDLKVVKGKLKELEPGSRKLVPSESGVITEELDITIISSKGQAWQVKEFYRNEDN